MADGPLRLRTSGRTIWTWSNVGAIEIDARTAHVLRQVNIGSDYPSQVVTSRGAAWIARVGSGYTTGALTRVDLTSGKTSTRVRTRDGAVFGVAAAGAHVWALAGPTSAARIVKIDPGTARQIGVVLGVAKPVAIAADASGLWVTTATGLLLHASASSARAHVVLRLAGEQVGTPLLALGNRSVWVAGGQTVLRIDERSEKAVARLRLPNTPDALAVGTDSVWALAIQPPNRSWLIKADLHLHRVIARAHVPFESTSVAVGAGQVWLGVTNSIPEVFRVDPRSLRLRLFARIF